MLKQQRHYSTFFKQRNNKLKLTMDGSENFSESVSNSAHVKDVIKLWGQGNETKKGNII